MSSRPSETDPEMAMEPEQQESKLKDLQYATTPMMAEDVKLDLTMDKFWLWRQHVKMHASAQGWHRLCTFETKDGTQVDLIEDFLDISHDMLNKAAQARKSEPFLAEQGRHMYTYLMNSLAAHAAQRICLRIQNIDLTDGPSLFHWIVTMTLPTNLLHALAEASTEIYEKSLSDFDENVLDYIEFFLRARMMLRASKTTRSEQEDQLLAHKLFSVLRTSVYETIRRRADTLQFTWEEIDAKKPNCKSLEKLTNHVIHCYNNEVCSRSSAPKVASGKEKTFWCTKHKWNKSHATHDCRAINQN